MPALDNAVANALLSSTLKAAAYTPPAGSFLTVGTGTPNATTNMTESAVTRAAITWGPPTAGSVSNITNPVTFTNMPQQTTTAVEIWSAVTGGSRVYWYALPVPNQKATATGDTLSFAVGAITATLG